MTWEWSTLYVCFGMLTVLLMDSAIHEYGSEWPVRHWMLMLTLWPLVVVALAILTIFYWVMDND